MPHRSTTQTLERSTRLPGYFLSALLGVVALLANAVSVADTNEVADPELARVMSYLTLAVRDRQCLAEMPDSYPDSVITDYEACMHKNKGISYCRARQVDFEELSAMMRASRTLRNLPLDRLMKYVSARCIEVDGFIPPQLPLLEIEWPAECTGSMPVLLAHAASMHLPSESSEENTDKRQTCNGNSGLMFLDTECLHGGHGLPFAGHEGFCRWPIKPVRK